ncbi:MAG: zinc ribbon domain-containing protein [Lachnospiraceae bacterium]|nr:zinc ribbon domain-containing protein [Lachnospiraceae bacterium]
MGRFCRKCGKEVRQGAQFCRNCGEKIRSAPVSSMPSAQMPASSSGPVSGPVSRSQMNMTMQMQQQINANRQAAAVPAKARDPFGAFRVLLVMICLALIITGVIFIPGNIRAARAGRISTDGFVTSVSGEADSDGAVLEKGDRSLTDEQREAYAEINMRQDSSAAAEEVTSENMHDCSRRYDDDEGWVEVKEDEE